jgi:hypothetical protein
MKTNEIQLALCDITPEAAQLPDDYQAEAAAVRAKYPKAVEAIAEYKTVYLGHLEKYRELTSRLRAENLGPRELTILLLAEGWHKARAAELKTVIELPQALFDAFQKRLLGFRAALAGGRNVGNGGDVASSRSSMVKAGLDEFVRFINSVDTSVFTQKKAVAVLERLGCVFTLTVRRKAVAGRGKGKKEPSEGKRKGKK